MRSKPETISGKACRGCGSTVRYRANGKCVACQRRHRTNYNAKAQIEKQSKPPAVRGRPPRPKPVVQPETNNDVAMVIQRKKAACPTCTTPTACRWCVVVLMSEKSCRKNLSTPVTTA